MLELSGKNESVLDLGCGTGVFTKMLQQRHKIVIGADISKTAIKEGEKMGIKMVLVDLNERLPFPKNFFDTVTAGEIIEHIFNTSNFLKEISRVLKKGGKLILTTPNVASLARRIMLFFGISPFLETEINSKTAGHIRYFTKDSLFELLKKNGFKPNYFASDAVNFDNKGKHKSTKLADIFPTLGSSLIVSSTNTV